MTGGLLNEQHWDIAFKPYIQGEKGTLHTTAHLNGFRYLISSNHATIFQESLEQK